MAKRATKLTKSAVKHYGVFSQIDAEIYSAVRQYKNACDSLYWKKRAISELKAQLIGLERDEVNLQRKRQETLETLNDLFFKKEWHAPSLESVNHAMDEIVKFRQTVAPIDDNGDIAIEEK